MFNYYICNEAWRQLFTGHILIFTLCAIVVDLFVVNFLQHSWILSILLVSELTAISNSRYQKKKKVWKTNLSSSAANRWDRCSPIAKSGWVLAVNICKTILVQIQGYLSLLPSYLFSHDSWKGAKTGSSGDAQQWLSCHGREEVGGDSTCSCCSSVTNSHQIWNGLYSKAWISPCERGTTKLASLLRMQCCT